MVERSETEDIFGYSVDLKNRRIYFGSLDSEVDGEINWNSVELCIRAIRKLATDFPKKPIELHMSSLGGDCYEALRLYDVIQSCTCQIKFYGSGSIMSSAVWIMAGCDERWLDPNTTVMIHKGSVISSDQSLVDREIDTEESKRLDKLMFNILAENSRMGPEFWEDVAQRDIYLSADETIMLGLADKIVQPQKRGNLRKSRTYGLSQSPDKRTLQKLIKTMYERIHKGRFLPKIQLHVPKEEYDSELTIDNTPVPEIKKYTLSSEDKNSNEPIIEMENGEQ